MKPLYRLHVFSILFCAIALAQSNPLPFVNQPLVPDAVAPGHKGFTLTVNGTGFASSAVVYWNETTRITQFISSSQLQATIEAKDVAKAGTASVTVRNPHPGGGTSNVVFFPIREPGESVAFFPSATFPAAAVNAVGDFNNDGKLDVAVGSGSEIDIYLGKGDGTFSGPVKTLSVTPVASMLAADFNGDGKLDLAVLDGIGNTTVFLGKGDGSMVQKQVFRSSTTALVAGDFNGDAKLDLVVSGSTVDIYLGNGDGTFGSPQRISPGSYAGGGPAVGDFNGDGYLDLAVPNRSGSLGVFLGKGDGTFQSEVVYTPEYGGRSAFAADVNGDGILDIVTSGLSVLLGKGDGTFTEDGGVNLENSSYANINIGDFNGDGKLDAAVLVVVNSASLNLLLGNGDGTFQNPLALAAGNYPTSLSIGDFVGDGALDLVGGNLFLQTLAGLVPSSLNFGNENVGSTTSPQTATLTNVGSSKLDIKSIGINGNDPKDFAQKNNCPASLPAGKSCQIQVTFTPTTTGTRLASLYVNFQGFGSPQTVGLSGTGVDLTVTLTPSSMSFATQLINTTSPSQTATLTNTGSQDVTISSISTTAEFSQTNNCPSMLSGGNSCQIKVSFAPTSKGAAKGQLSVADNAAGSPQTVKLSGTGTVVKLSTSGINFGNQKVGTKSPEVPVKLTNEGSTSLSISQIDITGADAGDFSQANNCGKSVKAEGSCIIKVAFKPTAKGRRSGTLEVNDNGGGSPQKVALAGTGT
jgi:FG-GAP-like repeat/Abnormal spindle-like microcephaly-assoc'd, ASPM-SPD-2-Hydin